MKTAHVAPQKLKIVEDLCRLFSEYPIVGAVNMENLPAPQLQKMKKKLKGKVILFMTKRRLIRIAIEKSKDKIEGIDQLSTYLAGMPALIFTKENPFSLYRTLKENKSKAPAKPGQIAPHDIIVPAGPTPFAPGPIIGELGMLGIKAGVDSGKVVIKQDSIVAKQGDPIKPKAAEIMARLGIEPMEVGLDIIATLESGTLYLKSVLDVDQEKFLSDLAMSNNNAINVSVFTAYPTKDSIELILSKANSDARNLGISQDIIDKEIIDILIGKANSHLLGFKDATKFETKENELSKPSKNAEQQKPEIKKSKEQKDKTTDEKVAELVKKAKDHAEGKEVTANKIIEEIKKEEPKIKVGINETNKLDKDKVKRAEMQSVEDLTKNLIRKGTLR